MLSDKIESAIVKLCSDIEQCPIKTIYFEQWFLRNNMRDFIEKATSCAEYEIKSDTSQTACQIFNYMRNIPNGNFYEKYEMILEKKQCDKNTRDYLKILNNTSDDKSKEIAEFYDTWANMILDNKFKFDTIKKYTMNIQQWFMSFYFAYVIKYVCIYNDDKLTSIINKNLKNMSIPELFTRINRNINKPSDMYSEYYDTKIFNNLDKYIDMINDLRSYLNDKKKSGDLKIKNIKYDLKSSEKDKIYKLCYDTIQYICDLSKKETFISPSAKAILKEYLFSFSGAISGINYAFGSAFIAEYNEITVFCKFIDDRIKNADFDFSFDETSLKEKIDDFHILPNKSLMFLDNLCKCVLTGKFDMNYIINTKMLLPFLKFYNKHVKVNIVMYEDKYKKFLNDNLSGLGRPLYTNSTPIEFDLNGSVQLFDFVNNMNTYDYEIINLNIKKEKVIKKDTKSDALAEKLDDSKKVKKVVKKAKEKIPATVRNVVWSQYNGENAYGKCYCCNTENISKANFECGHVISEKNGGGITIDNLRPICGLCNKSMGICDMNIFMEKYGFAKMTKGGKTLKKEDIDLPEILKVDTDIDKLCDNDQIIKKLLNYKNDELKKICKTLDMPKTTYSNKNEYVAALNNFLTKITKQEIIDILPDIKIKSKDTKIEMIGNLLQYIIC